MLTISAIQRLTAARAGITVADLVGPNRTRPVAHPRQRAMYVTKRLLPERSYPLIGQRFGGRDHTTVIFACRRVEERMAANPAELAEVEGLLEELTPHAPTREELLAIRLELAELADRQAYLEARRQLLLSLLGAV